MKIHFLGANRQVTGSRYCLETATKQIMIDCGLFQERNFESRNWDRCPIPEQEVDAILLTHAHIDHAGLLPKFVKDGYRGPIYCTRPTAALLETMLRDAAKIQEEDIEYKRKRHQREHRKPRHPEEPLYTDEDVSEMLPLAVGQPYHHPFEVFPGITAVFHDAGHILGSSMIELTVTENGKSTKIVFSGDIGQWNKPIIRDPNLLTEADYLVMESTYGNRLHETAGDVETQLATIINDTARRGGNVVIPTFAVERAQELMYYFARLTQQKRIPPLPVFLDSPMAVDVTEIFNRFADCFDEEMWKLIQKETPPLHFPSLRFSRTAEESKRINELKEPCVIMSSSGMCNAGRIKHHLRQNIERPQSTILFVGYQSPGTLGRLILDRTPRVRIHGTDYQVRAQVAQIYGFSGHADRNGLLRWLTNFQQPPKQTFFTHGEEEVALAFAQHVRDVIRWPAYVPQYRETVDLL